MNKNMMLVIIALVAIVMMASFDMQFAPQAPFALPANVDPSTVLYVCPAADSTWDTLRNSLMPMVSAIRMMFFACATVLLFMWGWALYQNLLKDKFNASVYSKPWEFTKIFFWAGIIAMVVVATPNHYRRVQIKGATGEWVLCESTDPNVHAAVRAKDIKY